MRLPWTDRLPHILVIKCSVVLVLLFQPLYFVVVGGSEAPWFLVLSGPIAGLAFLLGVATRPAAWIGGCAVVLVVIVGWVAFLTANPDYVEEEAMTLIYVVAGNLAGVGLAVLTTLVDVGYRAIKHLMRPHQA